MVDCMECTNFIECHYSGQLTGRLTSCPDFKQKPMTNAQKIRAMTDEELEAFLIDVDLDKAGSPFITEWGKWLKQPAEGDA